MKSRKRNASAKTPRKTAPAGAGAHELGREPSPGPSRTPLGARLRAIRARIVASGTPLFATWEDVHKEVAERRGERS